MEFYENVKKLAKLQNLQIIPFLESLGINYSTYKGYKQCNNLPRADEAVKIAKALNTSVEYLVTGEEPAIDKKKIIAEYLTEQLSELV